MKIQQRKYIKASPKQPVAVRPRIPIHNDILNRLRAEKQKTTNEVPKNDYDVLQRAMNRRTSFDKREPGVSEPRWEEKDSDTVVMTISPESIELLAIASMRHSCCNDADFEIRYSYGSGIGTNIVAKCTRCKQRFDITDYGSW